MDSISNMLIMIKNAGLAGHESVSVPFSKINFEIAKILAKEGFVGQIFKRGRKIKKYIEINLLYEDKKPKISDVKRVSKSQKRVYVSVKEIWPVKQGYGISIISTNKGLMTGKEARKNNVGGEYICEVW